MLVLGEAVDRNTFLRFSSENDCLLSVNAKMCFNIKKRVFHVNGHNGTERQVSSIGGIGGQRYWVGLLNPGGGGRGLENNARNTGKRCK